MMNTNSNLPVSWFSPPLSNQDGVYQGRNGMIRLQSTMQRRGQQNNDRNNARQYNGFAIHTMRVCIVPQLLEQRLAAAHYDRIQEMAIASANFSAFVHEVGNHGVYYLTVRVVSPVVVSWNTLMDCPGIRNIVNSHRLPVILFKNVWWQQTNGFPAPLISSQDLAGGNNTSFACVGSVNVGFGDFEPNYFSTAVNQYQMNFVA